MRKFQMLIGGEWVDAAEGQTFASLDPFTGNDWAEIPRAGKADAELAVEAAKAAFEDGLWGRMHPSERGRLMRKLGTLIADNAAELAEIEVNDNGKLIAEMGGQLKYIPQWYDYFGGLADKIQGSVIPIDKPEMMNFTRREPLGVCVGITAWNSPLLLASFKLAPGLAAGNTFVLKPSEYASASTLAFARLFDEAGFPPGVVNVVTGFGNEIGDALVRHPDVAKISFTGSERTGKAIYETAARDLKKVTLELGGKSPNIVFADANLANAANGVVSGIFAAGGQTCIAGSRLLVQESVHDEFMERLTAIAASVKMGNPHNPDTQLGPMANRPQFDKVLSYLDVGRADGATVLTGGTAASRPECGNGIFVEPTIFTGVNNDMRIAREEVFGPVLAVIPFKNADDAIRIGNDTQYGLASGVWTESMRTALECSNRLKSGTVWVNTYRAISYLSPFGGYKSSGLGRESGLEAVDHYLQTKSVWLSTAEHVANPFVMR